MKMLKVIVFIVLMLLALLWFVPLVWMLATSLKPEGSDVLTFVKWFLPPYTLGNYSKVSEAAPVLKWTWNSVLSAGSSTLLVVVTQSLAAYVLSQIDFPGRKLVYWSVVLGLLIPAEAMIVPLYLLMNSLHLINTLASIILPAVASPLGVIILKQFYDGIHKDYSEAARLDGCGPLRIWWSIFMPMAAPSLAAVAIFSFLGSWNNFFWPFLSLSDPGGQTLPVGIPFFQTSYTKDYTTPMTAYSIATLPVLFLFLLLQKQFVRGVTLTGLKG